MNFVKVVKKNLDFGKIELNRKKKGINDMVAWIYIVSVIYFGFIGYTIGQHLEADKRLNLVRKIIEDKNSTIEQIKDALKFNYK